MEVDAVCLLAGHDRRSEDTGIDGGLGSGATTPAATITNFIEVPSIDELSRVGHAAHGGSVFQTKQAIPGVGYIANLSRTPRAICSA